MGIEIERKFKIKNETWRDYVEKAERVIQGYISDSDEDSGASVRVRVKGDKGYLTVKESGGKKLERLEYEYEIPLIDAAKMLKQFCDERVVKVRYYVNVGDHVWEIDEFLGDNKGLLRAEIELDATDEDFEMPTWVGEEITQDKRYSNEALARHPFSKWSANT